MNVVSRCIEADLGSWWFSDWRPERDHPLAWVVERIWDFEGRTTSPRERVFPNGSVELIVQLDDRYHDVAADGRTTRLTPWVCVTGVQTGPIVIEAPTAACRVLGIRFCPPGAWAVLGHPLSDLTDLTADLHDLMGTAAGELAERCADARTGAERVMQASAWVHECIHRSFASERLNPVVRRVERHIAWSAGTTPIGSLRAETGLSSRRLAAAFLQHVGITPKRYARIHRFRRALGLLNSRSKDLCDVALISGYYDQPHMNAEFRELSGLTPRQILHSRRYPGSTSLAEN